MLIEPDIPKAKKLMNKRLRKSFIKIAGAVLLFRLIGIVLSGESMMASFLSMLIALGVATILFFFLFRFILILSLKHQKITLDQDNIQIQMSRVTQADISWSDIERIKFNDDIITIHLASDSIHKRKTYEFGDHYTLDLSKIYNELEQRWLGEKTVS